MRKDSGFTLFEMAMVLSIIGLLIAGISVGAALLENARLASIVAMAQDASTAVKGFKARHKYLPGDLPLAAAVAAGLDPACNLALATAAVGNGAIDTATEQACAIDELFLTGLMKADSDPAAPGRYRLESHYGPVQIRAASTSAANNFPAGATVIEFANLPCTIARQVDARVDDGDIASDGVISSRAKASVTTCTEGGANDPVPFFAIQVN
jgi:prepilin-type N-terminal cleavage/methylation domain-containing protein